MQEYNIQSILDESIAFDAIVPTQQTTQLKALISQMVAEETARQSVERDALIDRLRVELKCERQKRKALEARLDNTEGQLEDLQIITGRERAFDRRRISKLEVKGAKNLGPTGKNQIEEIAAYLKDSPGYVAPFEAVKKHLGIKMGRFGDILTTPEAKDRFLVIQNPNDRRKRLLKLKPKIWF